MCNLWKGGANIPFGPPNNLPTFSFNFFVKQEKNNKCTKLKGRFLYNYSTATENISFEHKILAVLYIKIIYENKIITYVYKFRLSAV